MSDDELRAELRRRDLYVVSRLLLEQWVVVEGWRITDDSDPLGVVIERLSARPEATG